MIKLNPAEQNSLCVYITLHECISLRLPLTQLQTKQPGVVSAGPSFKEKLQLSPDCRLEAAVLREHGEHVLKSFSFAAFSKGLAPSGVRSPLLRQCFIANL